MEFLVPLSIMVFLNLFLTFRLLYMATMYTLNKDVKLSQFRINEGKFQIDFVLCQTAVSKYVRNSDFVLFIVLAKYIF